MNGKKTTWHISGMDCAHCETAVLQAIRGLDGLTDAAADCRSGTLSGFWDSGALPEAVLAGRIAEAGYALEPQSAALPLGRRLLRLAALLAVLAGLFALLALSPLQPLLSAFPTARAGMSLGALFAVGLTTSLHCVAMCGGINLSQSANAARAGREVSRANLSYNLGRLLSYTAVGGVVGAIGSAFRMSTRVQAAIQILAAVFMVLMALKLLDINGLRLRTPTLPGGLHRALLRRSGRSSLVIGLLNGLMPCGPLQAMQLYALSTGSWRMGALSMLCFCLGTIPLMLGFGLVSGKLNRRFASPMHVVSGVLVLVMGMAMLSNGLALSGVALRPSAGGAADAAGISGGVQLVRSELEWQSYPDITVKAGTPVRWVIHADEDKLTGCNNEMVIPALELRVPLTPGNNVVEFTVDEPGVIPYTCWMGMLSGSITVEAESP